MYGGGCTGTYCSSLANLSSWLTAHGIQFKLHFLFNESLIPRARAYLADEFLRSECDSLLFIDADIQFTPDHVITLFHLQTPESPYDVITFPYAKKNISYEKIVAAVNSGVADENPEILSQFVGDFVFNFVPGTASMAVTEPVEVMDAGTGFMMIRRKTFEKLNETNPELMFKPDHVRTEQFDGSREIMMYFPTPIDPESKRYLSEDYAFCSLVRKAGMKVWMCPWSSLPHMGSFNFTGDLVSMLKLGISPTADVGKLGKKL